VNILEVSDSFEERILEPGVLDILAEVASEQWVVVHHLSNDLSEVRVEVA